MNQPLFTAILCASIVSGSLNAQTHARERDPARTEERAHERARESTDMLVRELGLNDEQAMKVGGINSGFAKEMAALRTEGLDEAARKDRSRSLRRQRAAELKAVMTEEQYGRMKELEEAGRKERKAQGGSPGRGTKLHGKDGEFMPKLGLSDDQTKRVSAIDTRYADGMRELRAAHPDDTAHKAKAKALRAQRESDLRNVLTEEQFKKLVLLRKERREARSGTRNMEVK
jgi:hypothetical protein